MKLDRCLQEIANSFLRLFLSRNNPQLQQKFPTFHRNTMGNGLKMKNIPGGRKILQRAPYANRRTKISILLRPNLPEQRIETPIEVGRLIFILKPMQAPVERVFDEFNEIVLQEPGRLEEAARLLNNVMRGVVSGTLLSPYVGMWGVGPKEKRVAEHFSVDFNLEERECDDVSKRKAQEVEQIPESNDGIIEVKMDCKGVMQIEQNQITLQESRVSRDSSESPNWSQSYKSSTFIGKQHQFHWEIESRYQKAEIKLKIVDNLNTVCSFINKFIFDRRVKHKNNPRPRFLSEETNELRSRRSGQNHPQKKSSLWMARTLHSQNKPLAGSVNQKYPFKLLHESLLSRCRRRQFGTSKTPNLKSFKFGCFEERVGVDREFGNYLTDWCVDIVDEDEKNSNGVISPPQKPLVRNQYKYTKTGSIGEMLGFSEFLAKRLTNQLYLESQKRPGSSFSGKVVHRRLSGRLRNYWSGKMDSNKQRRDGYGSHGKKGRGSSHSLKRKGQFKNFDDGKSKNNIDSLAIDERKELESGDHSNSPKKRFRPLIRFNLPY